MTRATGEMTARSS